LHVLITCEDTPNRAEIKLEAAIEGVKKLLDVTEGEDELKKRQLMELAILNGTYRDGTQKDTKTKRCPSMMDNESLHTQLLRGHSFNPSTLAFQPAISRASSTQQIGAPLIISRGHMPMSMSMATAFNGTQLPPLITPQDATNLFSYPTGYPSPYDFGLASLLPDYSVPVSAPDGVASTGNHAFLYR